MTIEKYKRLNKWNKSHIVYKGKVYCLRDNIVKCIDKVEDYDKYIKATKKTIKNTKSTYKATKYGINTACYNLCYNVEHFTYQERENKKDIKCLQVFKKYVMRDLTPLKIDNDFIKNKLEEKQLNN